MFDLATEFGFLATFAVPSISAILVGSGSFGTDAQKREWTPCFCEVQPALTALAMYADCAVVF